MAKSPSPSHTKPRQRKIDLSLHPAFSPAPAPATCTPPSLPHFPGSSIAPNRLLSLSRLARLRPISPRLLSPTRNPESSRGPSSSQKYSLARYLGGQSPHCALHPILPSLQFPNPAYAP